MDLQAFHNLTESFKSIAASRPLNFVKVEGETAFPHFSNDQMGRKSPLQLPGIIYIIDEKEL